MERERRASREKREKRERGERVIQEKERGETSTNTECRQEEGNVMSGPKQH